LRHFTHVAARLRGRICLFWFVQFFFFVSWFVSSAGFFSLYTGPGEGIYFHVSSWRVGQSRKFAEHALVPALRHVLALYLRHAHQQGLLSHG
jgi:hypothetical protein